MNIREALIRQSPSLALQRAAADEIARLDAVVMDMARGVEMIDASVARMNTSHKNVVDLLTQAKESTA